MCCCTIKQKDIQFFDYHEPWSFSVVSYSINFTNPCHFSLDFLVNNKNFNNLFISQLFLFYNFMY